MKVKIRFKDNKEANLKYSKSIKIYPFLKDRLDRISDNTIIFDCTKPEIIKTIKNYFLEIGGKLEENMNFKEYYLNEGFSLSSARMGDIISYNHKHYLINGISNRSIYASEVIFKNNECDLSEPSYKSIDIKLWDPIERRKGQVVSKKGQYKFKKENV